MTDKLRSPFTNQVVTKAANPKGDRDDVYDHNSCPMFSEPHSMGKDTIPTVFEEGELNKTFYGPITGKAAVTSPMGSTRKEK